MAAEYVQGSPDDCEWAASGSRAPAAHSAARAWIRVFIACPIGRSTRWRGPRGGCSLHGRKPACSGRLDLGLIRSATKVPSTPPGGCVKFRKDPARMGRPEGQRRRAMSGFLDIFVDEMVGRFD